ncbi:MAG: response regulator transcription factor [Dehalococcoidia bacterium]|nr:MAG: response regulator transcription factor [Dehalococcoidia bacterium]
MKVLIIEDNPEIVEAISLMFQIRWPDAQLVSTHLAEKGIELVESEAPDIVILDLGLPDMNGFEVLKQIRVFSTVPIVILTVREEEADVVRGLEWGADDYVVKPFRQMELLARVKAVMRRKSPSGDDRPLVCGPLRFHPPTRQLLYGEREIRLTATEGHILHHLMRNADRVVTHSSLAEEVWGGDYPGAADSLKVHIRRLRQKLEADSSHPQLIRTKAGIGYFLAKPGWP